MSYTLYGGALVTKWTKLTGNGATAVLDLGKRTSIASIVFTETAGSTPNVTIDISDGTTIFYLRAAKAMAAKETVIFDEPFALDVNQKLRVTSSNAAGGVDVLVNYVIPTAVSSIPGR